MGKYLKPRLKFSKKLGYKIENFSEKKNKKTKIINNHNKSDYCNKLFEKQKIKRTYGIFEKQFKLYYKKSIGKKNILENLLYYLEHRLDNVIFRSGFAISRAHARQLINHKLIYVNKKKVNIPSFQVKINDNIKISQKLKNNITINLSLKKYNLINNNWIKLYLDEYSFQIIDIPDLKSLELNYNNDCITQIYK